MRLLTFLEAADADIREQEKEHGVEHRITKASDNIISISPVGCFFSSLFLFGYINKHPFF